MNLLETVDQYGLTVDQQKAVEADLIKGVKPHAIVANLGSVTQTNINEIRGEVIRGLKGTKTYAALAKQFRLERSVITEIMNKRSKV